MFRGPGCLAGGVDVPSGGRGEAAPRAGVGVGGVVPTVGVTDVLRRRRVAEAKLPQKSIVYL